MSGAARSFLITGHPRSGTTLLTRVLNTHPEIGATYELGTFIRLDAPYPEYRRGLRLGYRERPVLDVGLGTPRGRRWASRRFLARFRYGLWRRRYSPITLEALTDLLGRILERTLVGDKLPRYVFALDELVQREGLRRIVIVRDCRAVTASALDRVRTGWSGQGWTERIDTPEKVAGNWLRAVASVERHAERLHVVRFEDLVGDPKSSLKDVAAYLGVDPDGFDTMLIRRPDGKKMRRMLDEGDLAAVEEVAGEAMRRWGYEPA
ncbi:MAG TPA: sulfotransferase [Gemmatimonadota bacterium]|nr:sulfotransferase [Gemmatimonadota bacterium]